MSIVQVVKQINIFSCYFSCLSDRLWQTTFVWEINIFIFEEMDDSALTSFHTNTSVSNEYPILMQKGSADAKYSR